MLLNVTDQSNESLQSQIIRQIRARILSGEIAESESLPSIRSLAKQLQVSVITIQRAYESLEREGLIVSRRGKGFFAEQLTEQKRTKLARQRLAEQIGPVIRAAKAEGMAPEEIRDTILEMLERLTVESPTRRHDG